MSVSSLSRSLRCRSGCLAPYGINSTRWEKTQRRPDPPTPPTRTRTQPPKSPGWPVALPACLCLAGPLRPGIGWRGAVRRLRSASSQAAYARPRALSSSPRRGPLWRRRRPDEDQVDPSEGRGDWRLAIGDETEPADDDRWRQAHAQTQHPTHNCKHNRTRDKLHTAAKGKPARLGIGPRTSDRTTPRDAKTLSIPPLTSLWSGSVSGLTAGPSIYLSPLLAYLVSSSSSTLSKIILAESRCNLRERQKRSHPHR